MVEPDATATPAPTASAAPTDQGTTEPGAPAPDAASPTATPTPAPTVEPTPAPTATEGATLQDVADRLDGMGHTQELTLVGLLVLAVIVALTCGVYIVRAMRS